jgi:hypothetical protein
MVFAWQGWRIEMPQRWSPVRLEGSYDEGYALICDIQRPRFGLRWKRAGKRLDAGAWTRKTMIAEVGRLAADEAVDDSGRDAGGWEAGRLYIEPQPPGRDVWAALSPTSGRTVELVYHAHRRDRILQQRLLPALADQSPGVMEWSVFDLSCRAPAGLELVAQRLNAGDLSLTFGDGRKAMASVRQIALASLALKRQPLEKWLVQQVRLRSKYYRAVGVVESDPDTTGLLRQASRTRLRWKWQWWVAPGFVTLARHDRQRDRLVLIDATSESLAMELLQSVAWAGGCEATGEDEDN